MSGYLFEGRYVLMPQVLSAVKDEALAAVGVQNPITVAIIGSAAAGDPEFPYEFFNARDAQDVFLSGNLVDAIRRAYSPGGDRGAYRVLGVRLDGDVAIPANRAVQATLTLQDSTPASAILLTASEWGLQGNNLAVAVANATDDPSAKKITLYWRGAEIVGDNIGGLGITVQYTGAGTAASLTISATSLATTVTGATGDNQTLTFATYGTLQKLVDALNATGKYVASLAGPNGDAPATDLDLATVTDIKTTAQTLRADLAAQLAWFASLGTEILVAAEAPSGSGKPAANLVKTFFSGGVDPTITTNSWQQSLDALVTENVQIVVPVTSDSTVHAMCRTHAESMSGVTDKGERVAIVGGAWGTSVASARGAAQTLNSDRAQYVYPGIYEDGGDGTLVQVPPYMVAAMKAGLTAGLPSGESATFKYINAAGIELRLGLGPIESLLKSGVCPIQFAQGQGYRVVQDKTTWLKDTRLTRRELALRLLLDTISRRLRAVAENYIGRPASPTFKGEITAACTAELTRMASAGLIVGDNANPAFRNMTVILNGEVVELSVEISIAAPANYIGIRIIPSIYVGQAA